MLAAVPLEVHSSEPGVLAAVSGSQRFSLIFAFLPRSSRR
jgi:hypothetical protein